MFDTLRVFASAAKVMKMQVKRPPTEHPFISERIVRIGVCIPEDKKIMFAIR